MYVIVLSTRVILHFLEHDDACDSQKYSRCSVWQPSYPVLVVLQDRDCPFLCEVHCDALLHVRNLAEVGRMFGLPDLSLPLLTDPSAHGSGNSPSCGSRASMTLTLFSCDSSTSATSTTPFQFLPHTRRSAKKCHRGRYCRTGGASSGLLHTSVDMHSLNEKSCWPSLSSQIAFHMDFCRVIRCLEHCGNSRKLSVESAPNIVHRVWITEG